MLKTLQYYRQYLLLLMDTLFPYAALNSPKSFNVILPLKA